MLGLVFVMLACSFVSAATTEINVKTLKNVRVSIFILNPAEVYGLYDSYHINSGEEAFVSVSFTGDYNQIKLRVQLQEGNNILLLEKFDEEPFETGSPLYLQVIPGMVSKNYLEAEEVAIENSTEEASEELIQESTVVEESAKTNNESLTGFAVTAKGNPRSNLMYYIVGVIVLVSLVGFVLIKIFRRSSFDSYEGNSKGFQRISSPPSTPGESSALQIRLLEMQNELAQAKTELSRMKNASRIQEIEKRIEEEKREIEKLSKQ